MSLYLGKSFDRNYNLKVSFLDGFYIVKIFYNKRSLLLLFDIENNNTITSETPINIKTFKNLRSSEFCHKFINFYNYNKGSLDIVNQFYGVKPIGENIVNMFINERVVLNRFLIDNNEVFESLFIYGFNLVPYPNEYVFIICERHNIVTRLSKKIVRTTAIEIMTNKTFNFIKEY